jgi:RND family efflux transporter MFP subunit
MVVSCGLGRRLTAFVGFLGICIGGCSAGAPPVAELPPPPVSVSQPIVGNVIDYDTFEGRIAAVETVEVRARAKGHLNKINFQDGQLVKKGDLLFEIDPRPYQASLDGAEALVAAAEADLKFAKSEYERIRGLAAKNAASREELEVWISKQAVANASKLKALAEVEKARLDLGFTKVTAEQAGKISRNYVSVGNLINAAGGETLLTTIVSVDPIYVYFDVDERAMLRYRRQGGARKPGESEPPLKDLKIPVEVALEGETGFPHKGVIDFADNRVNRSTGTIEIRGVLSNASGIFDDGLRARVRVPVSDPYKALRVSERAIGTDQGRKFVYLVNNQNVVERRDVVLDRVIDGLQVVREGLKPDDWVIVNGIQRVRDGMKVDPKRVPMPDAPAAAKPSK